MKYLITGVTGFVGKHLAELLSKNGHTVSGLYRTYQEIENVNMLKCDLLDINQIYDIFRNNKFDGVFNLAAQTHIPTAFNSPMDTFKVNTLSTIGICDAIQKYNPECILMHCSSGDVYGAYTEDTLIDETFPLLPNNPYAVSKASADLYVIERFKNTGLKGFIVRPFSHTGPGRPARFSISSDAIQIARIINGKQEPIIKVGNLDTKRAVMDVRDVVTIYSLLMEKTEREISNNGEVYNIGGKNIYTMGYYLNTMIDIFNLSNIKQEIDPWLFRPIDSAVQNPNTTKLSRVLNHKIHYDIKTTLRDLVDYWINMEQYER